MLKYALVFGAVCAGGLACASSTQAGLQAPEPIALVLASSAWAEAKAGMVRSLIANGSDSLVASAVPAAVAGRLEFADLPLNSPVRIVWGAVDGSIAEFRVRFAVVGDTVFLLNPIHDGMLDQGLAPEAWNAAVTRGSMRSFASPSGAIEVACAVHSLRFNTFPAATCAGENEITMRFGGIGWVVELRALHDTVGVALNGSIFRVQSR